MACVHDHKRDDDCLRAARVTRDEALRFIRHHMAAALRNPRRRADHEKSAAWYAAKFNIIPEVPGPSWKKSEYLKS